MTSNYRTNIYVPTPRSVSCRRPGKVAILTMLLLLGEGTLGSWNLLLLPLLDVAMFYSGARAHTRKLDYNFLLLRHIRICRQTCDANANAKAAPKVMRRGAVQTKW